MIHCKICGREVKQVTSSHLRSHSLTLIEYKVRFPNAPIIDEETSRAISSKLVGKERSQEHKDNISRVVSTQYQNGRQANKGKLGKKDSDDTRDLKRQRRLGKTHSQATKDKIGNSHKGKTQPAEAIERQKVTMVRRIEENGGGFATGPRSQDMKDKMSLIAQARDESEWRPKVEAMWEARHNQEITDDMRETYRRARLKVMRDNPESVGIKVWFDTKPELEFESILKAKGLSYKKQFHSSNPHYLYDFLVEEKLIVEIDGPWHYKASLHGTPKAFSKMQSRDAAKNLAAGRLGYHIARIEVGQKLSDNWEDILRLQGIDLDNL